MLFNEELLTRDRKLESFIASLPDKVLSSNDFAKDTRYRKKDKALNCRYIAVSQVMRKQIIIDIDRKNSGFEWETLNLPAPTYIVINPNNGHCHYVYELRKAVVFSDKGRVEPQNYFRSVALTLTRLLHGDMGYAGLLTKNPLHKDWKLLWYGKQYDLGDFQEYIKIDTYHKPKGFLLGLGRNSSTFDVVRKWGYGEVHRHSTRQSFNDAIQAMAYSVNDQFKDHKSGQMSDKEVSSIIKSISNWTWKNRHNIGIKKGVMKPLPMTMDTTTKCRAGAYYSHESRKTSTADLILASALEIRKEGRFITQAEVAKRANISLKTVKRHWQKLDEKIDVSWRMVA